MDQHSVSLWLMSLTSLLASLPTQPPDFTRGQPSCSACIYVVSELDTFGLLFHAIFCSGSGVAIPATGKMHTCLTLASQICSCDLPVGS